MKEQFFYLLKLGLGFSNASPEGFPLIEKEWETIWLHAKKQTVCGLIFAGIEKLPKEMQPQKELMIKFWALTENIRKNNLRMKVVAEEINGWFEEKGLEPCVIKGLTVGALYPVPELRMPGDIDLFFHRDYNKAVEIVENKGIKVIYDPNHDKFNYNGVSVELHHKAIRGLYSFDNIDFSPMFFDNEKYQGRVLRTKANALLLLMHPAKHFMDEGIGLRHLCDWAMFLKRYEENPEVCEAWEEVKRQGAERFAIEFTAIAVHYLGLKLNNPDKWIGKSDLKLRKKMLDIIIKRGNFANNIKKTRNNNYLRYSFFLGKHFIDTYPFWKSFCKIYIPKRISYRVYCFLKGKPFATK